MFSRFSFPGTALLLGSLLLTDLTLHASSNAQTSRTVATDTSETRPPKSKKKRRKKRSVLKENQQRIAAPTPEEHEEIPSTRDPFEKINRGVFSFNHQVYRFVTKPLARLTDFLLPEPLRDGISNAFDNLKAPVRICASLLQGKGRLASQETAKLVVNSTVGIGGLWKASERIPSLKGIPEEDFGQTFGKWGVPAGPYLVLPVLGPRNLRDLAGEAANSCASPQTWVGTSSLRIWLSASDNIQRNPHRMRLYDDAIQDAIDPYIAMREGYSNYRASLISR